MNIARALLVASCLIICTGAAMIAQQFRPYPGSKLDQKAGRQASAPGTICEVYTTRDSFEKVYTFYNALYKEYPWPMEPPDTDEKIKWAFFILDGGKDLSHSKFWIKVQRPYIGDVAEGSADFKNVREVTLIQTVRHN